VARQAINESVPVWVSEIDLAIPEPDNAAAYLVRSISVDTARSISKRFTRQGFRNRDEKRNQDAINDAMLDHALVDWKGVELNGAPLKCDGLANKKALPGFVIGAIVEFACAGHTTTPEDRDESFRTTA
jgi:hypothetical protein